MKRIEVQRVIADQATLMAGLDKLEGVAAGKPFVAGKPYSLVGHLLARTQGDLKVLGVTYRVVAPRKMNDLTAVGAMELALGVKTGELGDGLENQITKLTNLNEFCDEVAIELRALATMLTAGLIGRGPGRPSAPKATTTPAPAAQVSDTPAA